MGKYEPLGAFLRSQKQARIPMTFAQIERILKAKLPMSKKQRAWWSNNPDNNVMTREWLDAGFETEAVDLAAQKLIFHRKPSQHALAKPPPSVNSGSSEGLPPIFGCMKGLITLADDYDPTEPTGEDWDVGDLGEPDRK